MLWTYFSISFDSLHFSCCWLPVSHKPLKIGTFIPLSVISICGYSEWMQKLQNISVIQLQISLYLNDCTLFYHEFHKIMCFSILVLKTFLKILRYCLYCQIVLYKTILNTCPNPNYNMIFTWFWCITRSHDLQQKTSSESILYPLSIW